jgi:hypothetical protein
MALWSCYSIARSDETWHRNGAASRAECSFVPSGRAGCIGASQSSGLLNDKISWPEVWLGVGCKFGATERAHKRNGGRIDAE